MNKFHNEEAALALIGPDTKLLKGRASVRQAFFTREQSVTSAIAAKFFGGEGCAFDSLEQKTATGKRACDQ